MPSKGKTGKSKASEATTTQPPPSSKTKTTAPAPTTTTTTLPDLLTHRLGSPSLSFSALSAQDQSAWLAARIVSRLAKRPNISVNSSLGGKLVAGGGAKTVKEAWKVVNEGNLPFRFATRGIRGEEKKQDQSQAQAQGQVQGGLQTQRQGQAPGQRGDSWRGRLERKWRLSALQVESQSFRDKRARGDIVIDEREVFEETRRRKEMAQLKRELYGGGVGKDGKLRMDPEWDDVTPIVLEEPEGALAAIAYPKDYAEAMAYLRAVMQAKEHSPRCLRLTEYIIEMNPSHYTVWLYRAANVFALHLPIPDEIAWLNRVALANLKNYQIWHHRHLLVENYFPSIASSPSEISAFAASERDFLRAILAEDTKNYHVWSYRSYLVGKLALWDSADELAAIEAMVDDDVRNNSAWSHRFFLVFSNPAHCTPGKAATEADEKVPAEIVDREVAYAKSKIALAPQNQSGWNYLRGALVKGGRKLASVEEFASGFVKGLGEGEEDVLSTHALDLLAEIYAEKGDKERADLSLRRLGEKWDQIRLGYWEWRRKCLEVPAAA